MNLNGLAQHVSQENEWYNIQGGPKNSKPAYFCNNFVYCQPMFIIFGTRKVETKYRVEFNIGRQRESVEGSDHCKKTLLPFSREWWSDVAESRQPDKKSRTAEPEMTRMNLLSSRRQ